MIAAQGAPLLQAAMALALALGFVLLATPRTAGTILLCAAQAAVVAVAALSRGAAAIAVVALLQAALLAWLAREPDLAHRLAATGRSASPDPGTGRPIWHVLPAGAVLAALGGVIPGLGLPFGIVLLGLLLLATRRQPIHQALGLVAAQNGLVLTALAARPTDWTLLPIVLPLLPAIAAGALWLGADPDRTRRLLAPPPAGWIDGAVCSLALAFAGTLPWQLGRYGSLWRLDARAVQFAILLCALSAAAGWAQGQRRTAWGSRLAILGGTLLAVLADAPLVGWAGMAIATMGAAGTALPVRAEAWRRLRLGCVGLSLALAATVQLHAAAPPPAGVALAMLGYGALALLAPELAIAAAALILRLPGAGVMPGAAAAAVLPGNATHTVLPIAGTNTLLLALGLLAPLLAALGIALAPAPRWQRTAPLMLLAQAGAAMFAFGLGTAAGALAGLVQLSALALTQCALLLARQGGLDRLAALAGLAGLPPAGVFPGLALIVWATAATAPWLLLPLGAVLAALAWAVLPQLPTGRRLDLSPAWLPLALLLVAGFAMPAPLLAWFRLAAR